MKAEKKSQPSLVLEPGKFYPTYMKDSVCFKISSMNSQCLLIAKIVDLQSYLCTLHLVIGKYFLVIVYDSIFKNLVIP